MKFKFSVCWNYSYWICN
uniref:Uncharacterized protein n=1 Tax=Rhizophora mucronata TaxID=61149 RepID=A0A2P2ITV8_RHIMU